ncbi:hypothetical protein [Sinorhizobium fredii]|uniref:hypothetical protein n=1 Tax=Rhizobium fredii TaxID=380 RepID=UPI0004B7D1BE|nr:hypothetical protein [Sinorhizobium fredii]AWI57153.1 hypothetical protein AB395_00001494 [Sinorhizobium fredii CCBAU 45436]
MSDLNEALIMTGLTTIEELIDMANVGQSLMTAIDVHTKAPSLIEDWSPADDPAEIVGDLYNRFEESINCHKADLERLRAANKERDELRRKVRARSLTDQQIEDDLAAMDEVVKRRDDEEECVGRPPEWAYERIAELDHEKKRRGLERLLAEHNRAAPTMEDR